MKREQRPACKLVILFENRFKTRKLHLQPQSSALSNLRLVS
ncbi:DNA alkylation repair protein [Streptococcus pneumoniae]|nr:DNA alkylation repair protein [Streptococcus pneumoniae]